MGLWLDLVGERLRDASVATLVLTTFAAAAAIVCRQPARRIYLARCSLLAAAVLWPTAMFSAGPRIDLYRLGRAAANGGDILENSLPVSSSEPDLVHASVPILVARVTTFAYLSVAFFSLAGLALGHLGIRRLSRRARFPTPATRAIYDELVADDPIRRPELRVDVSLTRPILAGLASQTIILPEQLDRPEASQSLRPTLLHELAHAQAMDPWFQLTGSIASALWFFLPTVWWLSRRMRLDHEFLADRRAASAFGPPDQYASSLVNIAAGSGETRVRPLIAREATPALRSPGSALITRVLMLLRCPFELELRSPRWWRMLWAGAAVAAVLAASTLSIGDPARLRRLVERGWPVRLPQNRLVTPVRRVFDMERLVIEPRAGAVGPSAPFELPVRTPECFELTLDVWADPPSLASTKVAGLPLGSVNDDVGAMIRDDLERWHHVRLIRDAHGARLWVDDRLVNIGEPALTPALDFLCLQPAPHAVGRFEHLKLTW